MNEAFIAASPTFPPRLPTGPTNVHGLFRADNVKQTRPWLSRRVHWQATILHPQMRKTLSPPLFMKSPPLRHHQQLSGSSGAKGAKFAQEWFAFSSCLPPFPIQSLASSGNSSSRSWRWRKQPLVYKGTLLIEPSRRRRPRQSLGPHPPQFPFMVFHGRTKMRWETYTFFIVSHGIKQNAMIDPLFLGRIRSHGQTKAMIVPFGRL